MAADIYSKAGADARFLANTPEGREELASSSELSAAFVDQDAATARALMNGEAAIDIARLQRLFLSAPAGLWVQALTPSANDTATTLAASASIGATTLSVAGRLTPGRYKVDSETVTVTAISGSSAPYAVTLAAALTAGHVSGAAISTVELDYKLIRGLGGGRYGVRELTWKTNNPPNTPFYSNGLNQLGKVYIATAMTSVGRDDASITRVGTFSTGVQAAAYGGGYRWSSAANAQVSRTTGVGCTAAGMHFTIAADGSLWKISIDGDATRATLLKTAQQVVDDGIFPASILVANGGPFNPTDRVVSCFQNRSIIYDNLVAFADDLTPGAHAIVLNGYGVEPIYTAVQAAYTAGATKLRTTNQLTTGVTYRIGSETFTVTATSTTISTGVYESTLTSVLTGSYTVGANVLRTAARAYYSGLSEGSSATVPTTAGAEMFTTYSIHDEASTASAWEYADNERPAAGGTLTFIGSIHGYERQESLTVYNGTAAVTMTAGQTLAVGTGGRFRFVRTSTLFHPDAGSGTTPTKTATVEYVHDRQDLLVTSTMSYLVSMLMDLMYLMMPGNGCLSKTGVAMDRVALSSFPSSLTLAGGSDSRYGHSQSAASWMWSSTGKVGQMVAMPDVYGTLDGWQYSAKTLHQVQDRAGALTKIYIPTNGAGSEQRTIPAGTVKTRSARYTLGYFSGGAEAALAAA